MPLTNGSGSESGSCYFRHWPSRCQQKTNFLTQFFCIILYFLKVHLHHFSKIKSQKESQNSRNQGFSYYFCIMIEGSGSRSGSIPLTSESGSGRAKNMWIRTPNIGWLVSIGIRIQLLTSMQIRIQGAKPMRIHPDPYPDQTFTSEKVVFLNEKYTLCGYRRTGW